MQSHTAIYILAQNTSAVTTEQEKERFVTLRVVAIKALPYSRLITISNVADSTTTSGYLGLSFQTRGIFRIDVPIPVKSCGERGSTESG